ncbi:reverse transcriptase domain-containing protein [Tanacetum coccineum]
MKERYVKFIDLIKEDKINVPFVDVLTGMPNYGKFLKDLVRNKSTMEQISTAFLNKECSSIVQNKLPPKLVKNKELNHGVGDDRITFLIDKAMRHSHSNDDTCFRVDVIDEITDEEMDALLDDSKPFSTTSEKISESSLDHEFEEFMAIEIKEIPKQEEEVENNFKVLPFEGNQRIKISIQELLTDLVMKLLPEHLRYVFLEKDSLIPVVISALLQDDEKKRLVSVLKKHKEAFAWKTSNILSISPSFCKHKINFKDDAKPIIQRQRRLNPSMKKVVKKRLSNFSLPVSFTPSKIVPAHLVLKWEKCLGLGHKVSSAGLEVEKAKINVITKLPPPTNVKVIRIFLGHAGFYCRFIKDFSKISRPMTKLLEKDIVFDFNKECIEAFEMLKEKLMNPPIMVSPYYSQQFELMCDVSNFAIKAVLGQREGKYFRPIHFASKTLNNAQQNYTVTEKELQAAVFAFDKFRSYLVLSKTIFDIEIKNEKGAENVAADHLSRLKNLHLEELRDDDIDDNFPDETLMNISSTKEDKIPWFAHFANFLVGKILRKGLTYAQRWKFFLEIKHYFWDEPYLFKMCPDGMIRRCVYGAETRKILDECHHGPTRGCYAPSTAAKKVFDCWAVGKQSSKRLIL